MTLKRILEDVRMLRAQSGIPIVLMGYLNPIMAYGLNAFFQDAADAGVDGMILPELPLEEAQPFSALFKEHGLAQILLVAPTTSDDRMKEIDTNSTGFVYCVSSTGVTGSSKSNGLGEYVRRARKFVRHNPLLVGFGITSVEEAVKASEDSDGVIIGSAYLKQLQDGTSVPAAAAWVREVRTGLDVTAGKSRE
jgi:tryptophan synthase alpha chain